MVGNGVNTINNLLTYYECLSAFNNKLLTHIDNYLQAS